MRVYELTVNVDLQLAQLSLVIPRKLHDKIPVRRQAAGTLQVTQVLYQGNTGNYI